MYFIQFDLARTLREDRLHEADVERCRRRLYDEQAHRTAGSAPSVGRVANAPVSGLSGWSRIAHALGM